MYIHIADITDDNVRMILPPSSDGQAPTVYTYTVDGLGSPLSMTFDGTHIHIADQSDDNVRMILPPSSDGQAPTVYTYTVDGLGTPSGMTFDGTHIHIADQSDDNVRMILPPSSDGQAPTVYTYTVDGLGNASGMTFDGTHIHIADFSDDNVRMILLPSSNGQAPTVYTYTVGGLGTPSGMTFDGTHIHIAVQGDTNVRMILLPSSNGQAPTVYTYTVGGLGDPQGMTFDGAITSQAVLTLTTTDTDIRVGEAVDINIASDIDITGFTASDITVTGGTRGALTGSGTSWTLAVTAGSAGTMTIAIAEDAVSPGNTAVSQNFTVNARATATITFDDTTGESGGSTGVNIAFGESVTGLTLADLSASAGTLSNLTGSGASWEADLAFPATGSGTVTVTLAEDSVIPQNAEAEASIDYAEPLELAWIVPTAPTDNTFQVTLTSNHELTGVALSDFRLRIQDNSEAVIILDATNATLTAVAGTNNWRLDISLTGTLDADYTMRVRRNSLMFDGMNVPAPALASAAFAIDSSLGVDAVLDITLDAISVEQGEVVNATFSFDKAVGGFTAADVTISDGTKGALTDNGDNTYSMPITAPATGSGTVSVSVAADVVTPGNNSDTVLFSYTEPVVPLSFGTGMIANQAWVVGTAESLRLPSATGGTGTITYSLSPTLPAGMTFTASSRDLAGTPTGRFTSATFTYTATDGNSDTVELTFTIVVTATAITFVSNIANQAWTVGTAVNLTLPTATGGVGTLAYSLTPTLPSGVTFTDATRVLAGNPTATAAVATFTYTATDAESVTHTQTFTVVVTASAITFASTIAAQAWVVGTAVSLTLPIASGGVGAFTYSLTPMLPAGTSFVAGTRVLSGTPTGRFTSATFTYTAEDSDGETLTQTFTIVVTAAAITFASTVANQSWVVGTAVNLTLPTASGGVGAFTYALTPAVPSGITFTAGTRALAGNPSTVFSVATFTYTATDTEGIANSQTFTIVVAAAVVALSFGAETIANQAWVVGTAESLMLPEATGGEGTITYSLSPSTLPDGVTFTASSRILAGSPTGRFTSDTFTYTATDGDGTTVELTFTIVVTAVAITFSPASFANQTWEVGTAVALTLPVGAGGVGSLIPTLTPSLPSGVTFTASTRALAGNPTAVFTSATFTYTMTDDEDESASITFTIVVAAAAVVIPSNLTGSGIQVGSASQFGIGFGGPVGLASDGTTVYMFHLRRGYTLDPLTGIATQFGGNNLGLSFNPRLSAAMYHNGLITVHGTQNDQLYTLDTATNTLTAIGTAFTIAGSNSSPVVTGITSLNGVVYAAEAFTDSLMTLDIPSGVLTPVDADTVGYGLTSPNIQSLAAYKGMLVAVNIDSTVLAIRLVELSQADGTATAFNNIVPPDNAITGMVEHDDKLLAAGNANDALFRMYDVLWDETIADFEVDEGADATFDLAAISQDASIYSLPGTPPSWLTITGADTDLVATTAPDVTADTNYDVVVRATRSGINVDQTLRIVVKETGGTPPTNNAPAFANAFYTFTDVPIAVGEIVGTVAATDADNDPLTYSLEGTDATDFAIDVNGQYNCSGRINKFTTICF